MIVPHLYCPRRNLHRALNKTHNLQQNYTTLPLSYTTLFHSTKRVKPLVLPSSQKRTPYLIHRLSPTLGSNTLHSALPFRRAVLPPTQHYLNPLITPCHSHRFSAQYRAESPSWYSAAPHSVLPPSQRSTAPPQRTHVRHNTFPPHTRRRASPPLLHSKRMPLLGQILIRCVDRQKSP